jgi:hypothetical protein
MNEYSGGIQKIQELVVQQNQVQADLLMKQYSKVLLQREEALIQNIYQEQRQGTEFYLKHLDLYSKTFNQQGVLIDKSDAIIKAYYEYLSSVDEGVRESRFHVDRSVYSIPVVNLKPAAPVVQSRSDRMNELLTIAAPDGIAIQFMMMQPPTQDQVPLALKVAKSLRENKQFKEAQPISDWLKKWVNMTFGRDRELESWTYTEEAMRLLK